MILRDKHLTEQGFLTTHILDTARGCPASGVPICLYELDAEQRILLCEHVTNSDGRTDTPLIEKGNLRVGRYELLFQIGDYFADVRPISDYPFVDEVPIRFGIDDATDHYHVPLLASPFSFSTYRGS